jgi:hypothetical protein
MIHELKVWPAYFARLVDGTKTFEIRKDDRGFQAGDELVLREWNPQAIWGATQNKWLGCYTDRELRMRVGFVAKGTLFGLPLGEYAVLSLVPFDSAAGDG